MTSGFITPTGTLNIETNTSVVAVATSLPVKPDSAYVLLRGAYEKLGIPVTQRDDQRRAVGNNFLKTRRRIAGVLMQNVLDCGAKLGTPNAEMWDVQLTILSYVVDDGKGGSKLSTQIQALGHDPSVSDRDMTPCATMGNLEAKIGNTVKLLALTPGKKN